MSTPSALRIVSAPISNLKPRDLILSNAGVVPLGFVAQGDGTVVVKWSSPLDPNNPNESLSVVNGAQYTCQIDTIISSDVALLLFFGDNAAGAVHLGGGLSSGGGGGGDASAANQVLGLTALDSIYDALVLVGTEATSADILAAVQSLSGGASLNDLATALAPLATEATQADILAALEAQGVDVGLIQTNVALLVPDLDAVRVATEATNAAIGATSDTDTTNTVIGQLKNLGNQGRSANSATWTNLSVTTAAQQLSSIAINGARGVFLKNTVRRTPTVWVGRSDTITADDDSTSPTYPIEPGEEAFFDVSNANELWIISTSATNILMRVENQS